MYVPDVEAFDPQGERTFVTDAAPGKQGEPGGDEGGGEIVKGCPCALQSWLGGDDAPPVRLLLPEADEVDVIAKDFVLPE